MTHNVFWFYVSALYFPFHAYSEVNKDWDPSTSKTLKTLMQNLPKFEELYPDQNNGEASGQIN